MQTFSLPINGLQCRFDTDGVVSKPDGHEFGKWTTVDNALSVKPAAGGDALKIPVDWAFNGNNQLTVGKGGTELMAFAASTDGLPRLQLRNNVLFVDPDGDGDFSFQLACKFGLNAANGNLVVSISGKESEIDGYLADTQSRFRFEFPDKSFPAGVPNAFVLAGTWEPAGKKDEIRLHFVPKGADLEIANKPLTLPGQLKVDPRRNHLELFYQSNSFGAKRLQFAGSLEIKKGWKLVFRIDNASDGSLKSTTIEVESTFEWDGGQGALVLKVGKAKSSTAQQITVGGRLQATFDSGTSLRWDFDYINSKTGSKSTTNLATALQFVSKNAEVFIEYRKDGETVSKKITGKLVQDDFVLSGGIEVVNDPNGRRVGAFLGVSW